MTQELFELKMSETSNQDLANMAQEALSKLCKTGGRSLTMSVPPRVSDTDMLLCEIINRFKTLTNQ